MRMCFVHLQMQSCTKSRFDSTNNDSSNTILAKRNVNLEIVVKIEKGQYISTRRRGRDESNLGLFISPRTRHHGIARLYYLSNLSSEE